MNPGNDSEIKTEILASWFPDYSRLIGYTDKRTTLFAAETRLALDGVTGADLASAP